MTRKELKLALKYIIENLSTGDSFTFAYASDEVLEAIIKLVKDN
jgi:hypothetical protein